MQFLYRKSIFIYKHFMTRD